jgi:hypothetical protein
MTNISTETKGPLGIQGYESLYPTATAGYKRGLAVVYGADQFHATLVATAAVPILGLIEEDAVNVKEPLRVIEFGQTVAQVGGDFGSMVPLAVNAAGQLVAAQPGQPVVAVSLEPSTGIAGSYVTVFVLGFFGFQMPAGGNVSYYVAAGAIPVAGGTAVINGAAALAMTLAQPTAAQDGMILFITAETAHAHTITTAASGINGSKHVVTFTNQGDGVELEAINAVWNVRSLVGAAALS